MLLIKGTFEIMLGVGIGIFVRPQAANANNTVNVINIWEAAKNRKDGKLHK